MVVYNKKRKLGMLNTHRAHHVKKKKKKKKQRDAFFERLSNG